MTRNEEETPPTYACVRTDSLFSTGVFLFRLFFFRLALQCWTFQSDQAVDLKKMEKLNALMSAVMTRGADVDLDALEDN